MYHSIISALIATGTLDRRVPRGRARRMPPELAVLGDHQLRDIGFHREPTVVPFRHLMWM